MTWQHVEWSQDNTKWTRWNDKRTLYNISQQHIMTVLNIRQLWRSIVLGQGACLKGMSRTITMQGFRLAAITDVEKT